MRWWTPDPHPCLGGCGIILQHPGAKRCRKCYLAHATEKAKVQYWERRERGVCVECGKVPAFQGGRRCERHRERYREYVRKSKAKKRRRDQKFINCEICGALLRQNGNVKYCRPCSVDRNGAWHHRRRFARRKERGLCVECGRTEGAKIMCPMREGPEGKDFEMRGMPEGQEAEGDSSGDQERGEEQHPLGHIIDGLLELNTGCSLLEEIDVRFEREEWIEIRRLLEKFKQRIQEFYLNVGEVKGEWE